jgi:hypothetical protein
MNTDSAQISNGRTEVKERIPQRFLLKLRRGTVYSYWTANGEVSDQSEAEDIGDHREAHVLSQQLVRRPDIDGTEVEMVSK